MSSAWDRYVVVVRNEISLSPLDVFFEARNALVKESDIAIAFVQSEDGLFPTSPIPPDVPLPAISDGQPGSTRAADRLSIDLGEGAVSASAATVIISASPAFRPGELFSNQTAAFFSLWSTASCFEVNIAVAGDRKSHLVARLSDKGHEQIYESDTIIGDDDYFISLTLDQGMATVSVNGAVAIEFEIDSSIEFDRAYLAQSETESVSPLNGYVRQFLIYQTALLYPRILELYAELCPDKKNPALEHFWRNFVPLARGEGVREVEAACLADEAFSHFVNQLRFILPYLYDQFPPGKAFKEEDVRDAAWLLLCGRDGGRVDRESYSKIGRADLSVSYRYREGPLVEGQERTDHSRLERTFPVEFKIWGRAGYVDAPSQPIKYMKPGEIAGGLIMIDRRTKPSLESFRRIVSSNTRYDCVGIHEIPNLELGAHHFASFHRDLRDPMLKLVLNIYLPIAD